MTFRVSATLGYEVVTPATFVLNIHAQHAANQIVTEESLVVSPQFNTEELVMRDNHNRFLRMEVPEASQVSITYNALVNTTFKLTEAGKLTQVPVTEMGVDVLPYLYPSRYCQSDKLFRFAHTKFGNIENAYEKVFAITNWIHNNVEYLSGSTNSSTSAYDTVAEQAGVCRDFAHLGITLCRALDIPARYFTGYAYQLNPPDFHACFEAYLGGVWVLFDATGLVPLNGLVKIATGRDATDAAIASIFGTVNCTYIAASCEFAGEEFEPVNYGNGEHFGLTYL